MRGQRLIALLVCLTPLVASGMASGSARVQDEQAELEQLLAEERDDADRLRRRGDLRRARRMLEEHLDEDPSDAASRTLRALCLADEGDLSGAIDDARRALADAPSITSATGSGSELRRACARNLAHLLVTQGRPAAAVLVLTEGPLEPARDARDAWALGRAVWAAGERSLARDTLLAGIEGEEGRGWEHLLARARCERRLGHLERASRSLIQADAVAAKGFGPEPDVLVELAEVYFEADGEVQHEESQRRVPGALYKQALDYHPHHEGALVGLFRLHRFNWKRTSRSSMEILEELLLHHPRSVEGLLAGSSADLADGQLVSARARLERLRDLCPARREVRTLEAVLAWIEHRPEDTGLILAELAELDPHDGRPEREIARHLNELYRFAEALPFAGAATARDASDVEAWTQFGRALANTGREDEALEALQKATDLADGRQNAWRHNTRMVLARMQSSYVVESGPGDLSYAVEPLASEVLATYLRPFYESARSELAARYGYTPGPTRIEVFGRHQDFSVRSTGFEGFPALGVCFGPVVTAVSPVSELRGSFSWARTAFHEFTHVIHLGLSHNRCPRWITEGLATWEEEQRNQAWTRNMRRQLVDAEANGRLIPVRQLNRAFRGPRILFGYYQGGLLCRMLIEERGFPPMIRLLEAFDRGLDLDQALDEVYGKTPEQVDRELRAWVARRIEHLAIEPRWRPPVVARKKVALSKQPPSDAGGAAGAAAREAWAEDWCTVAWGSYQAGRHVDAEQALRLIDRAELAPARALFLRAEMALGRGNPARAREHYLAGLAAGGEDFRARMALGRLLMDDEDWAAAEQQFLAAERAFPGYDEQQLSAELHLAQVYAHLDRDDDMQRARERWLAWNSSEYPLRLRVARWHARQERYDEASRFFSEANEVDPFRRALHLEWGRALFAAGRYDEALRELDVALLVPPELDLDAPGELGDEQRAEILGRRALVLVELERLEEAGEAAREALELDAEAEHARRALERLQ